MIESYKLCIVLAVEHAQQNIPAILEKINLNAHPMVELLICYTDIDANIPILIGDHKNIKLLHCKTGSQIPHLWRDGIRASLSDRVAITTAHCIPAINWVDYLLNLELTEQRVGIGGVIENQPNANAKDWAIFFMRYINYAPPKQRTNTFNIAADNALYSRLAIMEHDDLLELGFWEPSFHKQFKNAGKTMQIEPSLSVFHHNTYTTTQFFSQRFEHGKAFGYERVNTSGSFKKILFILLSPILPFIFLRKIIKSVLQNGHYTKHLIPALPWLLVFLAGWGGGEATGYITSLKTNK